MAAHISTDQILAHIKKANKISVDGIIYTDIKITKTNLKVGEFVFPIDYFDVGGMDPNSFILVDKSHTWRRVQLHEDNNDTIKHPDWEQEDYDNTLVRNREVVAIANQKKFTK